MTHAELVEIAARWLRSAKRCGVVLTEAAGGGLEIPDAIGWRLGGRMSYLVECKASRADFLRDAQKPFRGPGRGVGQSRLYLAPAGMIRPDELPERWGLVEVSGQRARLRVAPAKVEVYNVDVSWRETGLLFAALSAVQAEPGTFCGLSGGRVLGRVRQPDGSWGESCAGCIRAKRACPCSRPAAPDLGEPTHPPANET